jgi:hypothetical protein
MDSLLPLFAGLVMTDVAAALVVAAAVNSELVAAVVVAASDVVAAFLELVVAVVAVAAALVVAVLLELVTAVDPAVAVKIFDHNNYRSFVYLVNLHLQH